jgi:hypothetical protein
MSAQNQATEEHLMSQKAHPLSADAGPMPAELARQRRVSIKPIFAWYDLWVGAFWDSTKRRLYLFPVPMLGVVIQFPSARPR